MAKWIGIIFIAFAILGNAVERKDLEIKSLTREIYLKAKYVRITYEIRVRCLAEKEVKEYIHKVNPAFEANLIDLLSFSDENHELRVEKEKSQSSFRIELPTLLPQKERIFRIIELYRDRLTPKPSTLKLDANEQKVEFEDLLQVEAEYSVLEQSTSVSLPSVRKIEYYTEEEAKKDTSNNLIKYGPFRAPYSYSPLRVHYELRQPLIYFPSVKQTIELSNFGSISVKENYELKNKAAGLEGEFNRYRYHILSYQQQAGHIFSKLHTRLPRTVFNLYYRDIIGNISTSVAMRNKQYVYFEAQPRFPVMGGWQTKWEQGYNLHAKNYIKYDIHKPDFYMFNYSFGYSFHKIHSDNYELRVVLPPGASDINIYLPLKASMRTEVFRSTLDIEGRVTVVISKDNMHSYYAKNFILTYRLPSTKVYEKPLLIILFFLVVFLIITAVSRLNLGLK